MNFFIYLVNIFLLLLIFDLNSLFGDEIKDNHKLLCFLSAGAENIDGKGKFSIEKIDPFLCKTIAYYDPGRIILTNDLQLKYADEKVGQMVKNSITYLKSINKDLEIILDFELIINSTIIKSCIQIGLNFEQFAKNLAKGLFTYNFDGLIYNFQNTNLTVQIVQNFANASHLVFKNSELALIGFVDIFDTSTISSYNYFDYIMLNTFGFGFPSETILRFISPLYSRQDETGFELFRNVDWIVNYFIRNGVPKNKILLGFSYTGNSYKIFDGKNSLGDKVKDVGIAGYYTKTPGQLTYYESCMIKNSSWVEKLNNIQYCPYSFTDSDWICYEDPLSMTFKGNYISQNGLGGAYVFSIDGDDFSGYFCSEGYYPLTKALIKIIGN